MLEDRKLQAIVRDIVGDRMPQLALQEILTDPAIDSEGKESLRITLVIPQEASGTITGDQAVQLISDIYRALDDQGDPRLATIHYLTPTDLAMIQDASEDN